VTIPARIDAKQSQVLSGRARIAIGIAFAIGLVLFVLSALTKAPHVDEGDLGSAALSLLDNGHFAFPMAYYYLANARTEYLLPPFYFGTLAGWFEIVGRSYAAYRLFHACFWILLVAAWTQVSSRISRTTSAVVIAALLLALNYDLINLGISRYDIVCAALNAAALAAYLRLRATRFTLAVVASNTFLALSAITHPNAMFGLLGCAMLVIGSGDWRRIKLRHVALGLLPYAVAFGAWALIIDGRWSLFIEQMTYGARSKRVDLGSPFAVLADDIRVRWIELFSGWRSGVPVVMRAKSIFPLLWLVAAARLLFYPRGDAVETGLRRALALFSLASAVLLAFTDTLHLQIYVVNVVPQCTAVLAIALSDYWEDRPAFRPLLATGVAGLAVFGIVSITYRVRMMELQRGYGNVVQAIRGNLEDDGLIVGPSELGYAFEFTKHVRNDPRLTSIGEGKLPQYVVRTVEQGVLDFPTSATCEQSTAGMDSVEYVQVQLPDAVEKYRVYRRQSKITPSDRTFRLRYCHSVPPIGGK